MVLRRQGERLRPEELDLPDPGPGQVSIDIAACGVCRTDLHIVDGDLTNPALPLIPGHEIVGHIRSLGPNVSSFLAGDRVGVPWLGHTCGACRYCRMGAENLCDQPGFTGYTINGGYAEACIADAGYVFHLPGDADPVELAPLLCAGLIGHRSLKKAGSGERLGIYGFGAAAHIVAQVAIWEGRSVFALTRPGDDVAQAFAKDLGCAWAGGSDQTPPAELDAAIIFAPVGALVPAALRGVRKGGTVVCGGIHMSDIPAFPYENLWGERTICSVANLTRADAEEFLALAPRAGIRTQTEVFPLTEANEALDRLRAGHLTGAAVLVPGTPRTVRR
ncbi:MAG: zinc-dependent alcohol dehydrogenase family protein [Paracoccaceae bacterium]|nr:zinc-dependent alcohol dehydrogenase family protein [Paracoccaceae bacterium]